MKKLLSILLALVLATGLFAACSGSGSGSQAAGSTASGSGAAAAPDGKKTDLLLWLPPFAAGDDGALLLAVGLMCAGWDGCADDTPGFPKDWNVEWEDILPLP